MYQGRHQSQGRLGGDEGEVHLGGPGGVLGISTQSISQRAEDQSSTRDKFPVEVHHSQELLQGGAVGEWWKNSDREDLLMERSRIRVGDWMSKILNLRSIQNTLLQVDGEAMEAAEVKGGGEVDNQLGSWRKPKYHPGRQNRKINHQSPCPSSSETSEQHSGGQKKGRETQRGQRGWWWRSLRYKQGTLEFENNLSKVRV